MLGSDVTIMAFWIGMTRNDIIISIFDEFLLKFRQCITNDYRNPIGIFGKFHETSIWLRSLQHPKLPTQQVVFVYFFVLNLMVFE